MSVFVVLNFLNLFAVNVMKVFKILSPVKVVLDALMFLTFNVSNGKLID
jgi:hypothetical protein